MRKSLQSITRILRLPAICALCSQYHDSQYAVCNYCINFFTKLTTYCKHCAMPLNAENMICGACLKHKPYFDHVYTQYLFEEPLRTLLHELKYREGLYLGSFLAALMAQNLSDELLKTQCLIPVPMHFTRLKKRGFNQAALLTKLLSKITGIPHELFSCEKNRNTKPQAHLNLSDRKLNIKNAFTVKNNHYQHITLVDDLITTGSTVNEIAKAFKKNGVLQVDVWCVARAI